MQIADVNAGSRQQGWLRRARGLVEVLTLSAAPCGAWLRAAAERSAGRGWPIGVGTALLRSARRLVGLWIERSRQRRALRALDDRLLRDIGLTRTDVAQEMRRPFWSG